MSPAEQVCVDASLAVKAVVSEPDSDKADALFAQWANEGKKLMPLTFSASRLTAFSGKKWPCVSN